MITHERILCTSTQPAKINTEVVILGLGNTLLQDEGVGVHIVNRLIADHEFPPEIELVDGGTFGLDLLPYIENKRYVILVDAVNFQREPGYTQLIENDNILTQLNTLMSVHHLGLSDVLSVAKLLDKEPKDICLIGIQPESIDAGLQISPTVTNAMETAIELIIQRLTQWGFPISN